MLVQRRRSWTNIDPALVQRLVFAADWHFSPFDSKGQMSEREIEKYWYMYITVHSK